MQVMDGTLVMTKHDVVREVAKKEEPLTTVSAHRRAMVDISVQKTTAARTTTPTTTTTTPTTTTTSKNVAQRCTGQEPEE